MLRERRDLNILNIMMYCIKQREMVHDMALSSQNLLFHLGQLPHRTDMRKSCVFLYASLSLSTALRIIRVALYFGRDIYRTRQLLRWQH